MKVLERGIPDDAMVGILNMKVRFDSGNPVLVTTDSVFLTFFYYIHLFCNNSTSELRARFIQYEIEKEHEIIF